MVIPQVPLIDADHGWLRKTVRRMLFGRPRDFQDRTLFHRLSLVAFLAWVGLGSDGLSSSAYGPAETFLALGKHTYLAVAMAVIIPFTVFVIATAYGKIIEAFPQGGGGYLVATKLLGPGPGVVSGGALVIDYVLTLTVSIAAAGEAIFSLLPVDWQGAKLPAEVVLIALGVIINIRGVKDAVLPLVPIFVMFILTHALLIGGAIFREVPHAGETMQQVSEGFGSGWKELGLWGMFIVFLRAYSLGAGTYTGIEAVSNGLNFMREPRVQTGKRTMAYMGFSLAIVSAGLLIGFLLIDVKPEEGKLLNAVLAERVVQGMPETLGSGLVWAMMLSEALILIVAAQTGFIGGPRVLANMALDSWVPKRFASLSDRLTTQNGILLMGATATVMLLLVRGNLPILIIMYTINVFISFTLSMAGMLRLSFGKWRRKERGGKRDLSLFTTGLILCVVILVGTSVLRFREGGAYALLMTTLLVVLCYFIRRHYVGVTKRILKLQKDLRVPDKAHAPTPPAFDASKPTAAVLVGGYSGLGMHTMLGAMTSFGGFFKNVVFVSVGVIDSGAFKGETELDALKQQTEEALKKYVDLANRLGVAAQYRYAIGIDPVETLETLCLEVQKEFGRISFFAGQLTFRHERWFDRILHNQTAFTLQRRLHWAGIPILILPIRVR